MSGAAPFAPLSDARLAELVRGRRCEVDACTEQHHDPITLSFAEASALIAEVRAARALREAVIHHSDVRDVPAVVVALAAYTAPRIHMPDVYITPEGAKTAREIAGSINADSPPNPSWVLPWPPPGPQPTAKE